MTQQITSFSLEEALEIEADAYFTALEALERAEHSAKQKGITRAFISKRSGIDKVTVTRVMGGAAKNVNLKTFFKLMTAMNRKVFISSEDNADLHAFKPNFNFDAPHISVSAQAFSNVVRTGASEKSKYNTAVVVGRT